MTANGRVLITGANRGIGLEFVRQYLAAGCEVIATCRDPVGASELHALSGTLRIAALDVASTDDLDALAADLAGVALDLLVCNAAVFGGPRSRFGDIDDDAWRTALEVNVVGTLRVATRLWENVAASEQRKIVFLTSRASLPREARPRMSYIYASSKAALNAAVRCLALDLRERGVLVALLNPGHVRTRIGGEAARMAPEESVAHMRRVIDSLGPGQEGRLWHFDGTELPL